jgi:hypothetical protein
MENTTAVEEKALRPRIEKIFFSSGDIVMVKHDIPNRPFMIVQSIDKLPVASGEVALLGVTCIWFSSDLKLQKSRFSTKDIIKNQSMIRFTITSGKLVLDPNIVLFKDLQDLFNCADGQSSFR